MKDNISPKKQYILILISFILISCGIPFLFYIKNAAIKEIHMDLEPQTNGMTYLFEQNDITGNRCIISGWLIENDTNLGFYNTQLLVKANDKYYKVNTKFVKRTDVTQAMNDGYNYDNSGFYCDFNIDKLPNSNSYQIYLLYTSAEKSLLIETNETIHTTPDKK